MLKKTLLTCLLLIATTLQAAHITDKLLVGIYETPDNSTKPQKVISSGTPLEVLKKEGSYSLVRLGDGSEGWIKSTYITAEKPAKAQLLELQAKTGELEQKLQQAENQLKRATNTATFSSDSNDKMQKELQASKSKLLQSEAKLQDLIDQLESK
ncbi:MAG: TIGR04211 family SH3 domain-containing protein [Dehalococcoidia bacterium]